MIRARDAELLTGVSQQSQFSWRKRGYLPANEGTRADFDLQLLLRLLVIKHLSLSQIDLAPMASLFDDLAAAAALYWRMPDTAGHRYSVIERQFSENGEMLDIVSYSIPSVIDLTSSPPAAVLVLIDNRAICDELARRAADVGISL